MAEAATVVETANKGVVVASSVLHLYNKTVNQVIPWNTFEKAMKELRDSKDEYSDAAAEIVGKVQTLLLNSCDEYSSSLEAVNTWCKMAVPVLGQYMCLFEHITNSKVAEAQKVLLLKVLNEGSKHMTDAISKLEASKRSFNVAFGQLTALRTQLQNDFSKGSDYFERAKSKLRAEAYGGAVAGIVLGPIGLAISYSIAAGVVEGELVPKLEKAFKETAEKFDNLQETVNQAQRSIESAKKALGEEIRVLGTMSAKIEETKAFAETWALVPLVLFGDFKKSTNQLIDMCKQYIVAAEKKTNN